MEVQGSTWSAGGTMSNLFRAAVRSFARLQRPAVEDAGRILAQPRRNAAQAEVAPDEVRPAGVLQVEEAVELVAHAQQRAGV